MPRKPQKPREQKIAEEFFPVEPQDIKYSIEKKNSPLDVELSGKKEKTFIEKTEVAITKKPRVKGKKPKQGSKVSSVRTKTKKETQYEPKKITLKKKKKLLFFFFVSGRNKKKKISFFFLGFWAPYSH